MAPISSVNMFIKLLLLSAVHLFLTTPPTAADQSSFVKLLGVGSTLQTPVMSAVSFAYQYETNGLVHIQYTGTGNRMEDLETETVTYLFNVF